MKRKLIAELLYQIEAELGEGILWDTYLKKIWWVDIKLGRLYLFDPDTKENHTYTIGRSVSAVVPFDGKSVLIAVRDGFALFDHLQDQFQMLVTIDHHNSSIRFNDGKCDPSGRFWAGTLAEDGTKGVGKLFCLLPDLSVEEKIVNVGISNGIGWNPAGNMMYYIDTMSQQIVQYDFDSLSGNISNRQIVLTIDPTEGSPDGMCVDQEGMLWVALWNGGKIICIDPYKREITTEIIVPNVTKVTSCAFGGDDMRTLFITTARSECSPEELKQQPFAGSLFTVKLDIPGLPSHHFKPLETQSHSM